MTRFALTTALENTQVRAFPALSRRLRDVGHGLWNLASALDRPGDRIMRARLDAYLAQREAARG